MEQTIEAELTEEGQRLEEEGAEEEDIRKEDPAQLEEDKLELKQKKSAISALRASLKNGEKDMFSEDYPFEELQLVIIRQKKKRVWEEKTVAMFILGFRPRGRGYIPSAKF